MNSSLKTHVKILSTFYEKPFLIFDPFLDPIELELTYIGDLPRDLLDEWPHKEYKWRGRITVREEHFPIIVGDHYYYATHPRKMVDTVMRLMEVTLKSGDIGIYQPHKPDAEPQIIPIEVFFPRYSLN